MADPETDHDLVYLEDGILNVALSPFFDVGFGEEATVDSYIDRICFLLSEMIKSQLGIHYRHQLDFSDTPLHPSYAGLQRLHRKESVPVPSATIVTADLPTPPSGGRLRKYGGKTAVCINLKQGGHGKL